MLPVLFPESMVLFEHLANVDLPPAPQAGQLGNDHSFLTFKRILEQSRYHLLFYGGVATLFQGGMLRLPLCWI